MRKDWFHNIKWVPFYFQRKCGYKSLATMELLGTHHWNGGESTLQNSHHLCFRDTNPVWGFSLMAPILWIREVGQGWQSYFFHCISIVCPYHILLVEHSRCIGVCFKVKVPTSSFTKRTWGHTLLPAKSQEWAFSPSSKLPHYLVSYILMKFCFYLTRFFTSLSLQSAGPGIVLIPLQTFGSPISVTPQGPTIGLRFRS